MESIEVTTKSRTEAADITEEVQAAVSRSQVNRGIVLVSSAHTTAACSASFCSGPVPLCGMMTPMLTVSGAAGCVEEVVRSQDGVMHNRLRADPIQQTNFPMV